MLPLALDSNKSPTHEYDNGIYSSNLKEDRVNEVNSHVTRKGNAWKFVKTLHVKFFPFGQKWPSRIVTVKHRFESSSLLPNSECFNINQFGSLSRHERNRKLILRSKIPVPNSIPNCIVYLEKIFRKIKFSKNQIFEVCCDVDEQFYRTICLSWNVFIKNI